MGRGVINPQRIKNSYKKVKVAHMEEDRQADRQTEDQVERGSQLQ